MTVGMTHAGKTTFAKKVQKAMGFHYVDNDEIALFLKERFASLYSQSKEHQKQYDIQWSKQTPRLKDSVRDSIVEYAALVKQNTVLSNGNIRKKYRTIELEYLKSLGFTTVIVYFDYSVAQLRTRIAQTQRSTACLTWMKDFYEVLDFQSSRLDVPNATEADHLFFIKENTKDAEILQSITELSG